MKDKNLNNVRKIFLSIYPDAKIEIVKKSAGRILTVNGFSALNLDDKGINSDLILSSMKRAYLVNKKK